MLFDNFVDFPTGQDYFLAFDRVSTLFLKFRSKGPHI
jgi:hypothetical protein